jgi:TonB family protein
MRILTLLLASVLATGESPAPGTLTRAPELVEFVPAEYPPDAEAAGIQGSVVLSIVIDTDGTVSKAEVVDPGPHPGFAAAALHAVAQFRFRPAEIDGVPAAVEISYRYDFVLRRSEPSPQPTEAPVSLEGRLVERGTRQPVAAATVEAAGQTAETTADGRFALRGVPPGEVTIRAASPDHEPFSVTERIEAGKVREVEYRLSRKHYDPYEAVVRGERTRREITVRSLSADEVRTVPGTQGDTLRVLQTLPGVARSPFGIGLLVVRGSEPQETVVYVDGIPIPLLFHFGGITSVVNSDVVDGIDFFPGNFSSRYGRALGGTVELRTKEPRKDWHGAAQFDIFDGRVEAEGPVGKGTAYAAVRRSWIDGVLAIALPKVSPQSANDLRVAPRYYDWQTKVTYPVLGGRGTAFAYGSDDKLEFIRPADKPGRPSFYLATGFWRTGLAHRAVLGEGQNDATLTVGKDNFDVLRGGTFGLLTDVWVISWREAYTYRLTPNLTLEAGTDGSIQRIAYSVYAPPSASPGTVGDPTADTQMTVGESASGWWFAPGAWLEADWRALPRLRVVGGLRADLEERFGRATPWLDPRLSAFYDLTPHTVLTAAVGLYGSAPQPQQTSSTFGNPDLAPQRALEYSVGVREELPWASKLELTGFYKDMWSLVVPTKNVDASGHLLRYSNEGKGETIGLETLLRRELSRGLFGWVSWTWSRALRRDDPTNPNYPRWHPFAFDQTQILAVVLSYRLPREWIVGTRVRSVTGNPYTPSAGAVYDADSGRFRCLPGSAYSQRLPGFFQADARVDKRWIYDRWMFSMYLDVQNVTNHQNTELRFQNYDCSSYTSIPSLPFLPSFGLRAEW